MKKLLAIILLSTLLLSFALAEQNQYGVDDEDDDPDDGIGKAYGNTIKTELKERNRLHIYAENRTENCPDNCTCEGAVTKCQLENGGREMTVRAGNSGNIIFQTKGVNASTQVTLYHQNGKVYGNFSGEEKEIVLPDEAQERIQNRTKARIQNMTLTEEGYYQIQAQKKSRLFFLFPVKEKVEAKVNAENGEVLRIRNPWWGFLAKDIENDDSKE